MLHDSQHHLTFQWCGLCTSNQCSRSGLLQCLSERNAVRCIGSHRLVPRMTPQALEYVCQALLTASLLLTGKWLIGLLQLGMLAFLVHSWSTRRHVVDATDVFRQLPVQKKVGLPHDRVEPVPR